MKEVVVRKVGLSAFSLVVFGAILTLGCHKATIASVGIHDGNDAINNPDKFAWEVLAEISRPVRNGSPDALWETWASKDDVYHSATGSPVFPPPGHRPPAFHTPVFVMEGRMHGLIIPQTAAEEIRMNRATFDFIVKRNLWTQTGQIAAFKKGASISFPKESIEIKADWVEIDTSQRAQFHWNVDVNNKLHGLVALHITTKDLPNWFWATFEHVDNKLRCEVNGCRDTFGLDDSKNPSGDLKTLLKNNLGPERLNYRLTGSQTDFVDGTGRITYLGNSVIEGQNKPTGGFMAHSSCITCHSEPRVNLRGFFPRRFSDKRVGTPDPCWFFRLGQGPDGPVCGGCGAPSEALQLDFVWSLKEPWP
jgi:hypothetical protein